MMMMIIAFDSGEKKELYPLFQHFFTGCQTMILLTCEIYDKTAVIGFMTPVICIILNLLTDSESIDKMNMTRSQTWYNLPKSFL